MSATKPIGTAPDHNPNQEWDDGHNSKKEPEPEDFYLDTEAHIYRRGNRIIPGVTETLQINFGKRIYWNEWYANRGKAVHLAIYYLVRDELNWDTVDERIKPRVEAFQKFLRETGFSVLSSEIQLFSKRYNFAGTIDLILGKHGDPKELILCDIKSSIEPIVELQLGAYSILYAENLKLVKKVCAVELKDNGSYNIKWFKDLKRAQRIFLSCLTVANWRKQYYQNP